MAFEIKRAERSKIKVRVALIGPSGSGKTYSALRLATGMVGGKLPGKIVLIDTENRRGEYYADEFEYDVIPFSPPYNPERFVEAITAVERGGYEVVIIDSASHEWVGEGGILDIKDKMPGSSEFQKWATLTPKHNLFIDKIVRSTIHVIVCLRGKDQYVLETNEKRKQAPRKVGVGAQQRDGLEYECTAAFLIDQEKHVANSTKDNTHLFDGRWNVLIEEDGAALIRWANEGKEAAPPLVSDLPNAEEYASFTKERNAIIAANSITKEQYTAVTADLSSAGLIRGVDAKGWNHNHWALVLNALESVNKEEAANE